MILLISRAIGSGPLSGKIINRDGCSTLRSGHDLPRDPEIPHPQRFFYGPSVTLTLNEQTLKKIDGELTAYEKQKQDGIGQSAADNGSQHSLND
jgi:hypothetical protein